MAVPPLRPGDTHGGCGYGREVPDRRGSVEQPFRPGSLLMPFYPAVLPDVTLAGGEDAVFKLPGGAQMVAVRVQDLVSPARRGWCAAMGGCRPPGIRLIMPAWAWRRSDWTR